MLMRVDPLGDFGFDRLVSIRLGTCRRMARQRVPARGWKRERRCGNFLHGGVLLGKWVLNNQIQTQVRRLLQLLIHNFWLYLSGRR